MTEFVVTENAFDVVTYYEEADIRPITVYYVCAVVLVMSVS